MPKQATHNDTFSTHPPDDFPKYASGPVTIPMTYAYLFRALLQNIEKWHSRQRKDVYYGKA